MSFGMSKNLPETLPIFPLSGVLLLPHSLLPLNIFEERYINMIDDALMAGHRMIGMIQPQVSDEKTTKETSITPVYKTGCAGKIISFSETPDNRYLITLSGISRFDITDDTLDEKRGYRTITPDWHNYEKDTKESSKVSIDRDHLTILLKDYFTKEDIKCDWDVILKADDERVIAALAMLCPFDPSEKQALLEAPCPQKRAGLFMTILEMAVRETRACDIPH